MAPVQAPGLSPICLNVSSTRDTVSDGGGLGAGPDEDQDSDGDDTAHPTATCSPSAMMSAEDCVCPRAREWV